MNITMNDIYIFHAKRGLLIVYGKTMQICKPYMVKTIKTIQHLFRYAQAHELKIIYASAYPIKGISEYLMIKRLMRKYHVKGSKTDMPDGFPLIL